VKKAEPRDLRLIPGCASTTTATLIVTPSFLPGPLAGSVPLAGAGLLTDSGSWCSPDGSGV